VRRYGLRDNQWDRIKGAASSWTRWRGASSRHLMLDLVGLLLGPIVLLLMVGGTAQDWAWVG